MHTRIEIHVGPTRERARPAYVTTDPTVIAALVAEARTQVDLMGSQPKFTNHNAGLTQVEDHLA